uniref:ARMC1 n=1 Tax=Schmidtea mediterranea TaxID=79327 RepID=H9CXV5_SCHMD|nr:ARMC1 [Schmidtea mediterranea]
MNHQTVQDLKIMSLNPLSARLLGQDFTCIGGLILLLSSDQEKVILDILEIFHNLIVNENNKQFLREFIGIKQQLECLESRYLSGTVIHMSASKLKNKLYKASVKRFTSVIKKEPKIKDSFKIKNSRNFIIELNGLTDMETVEEIKNNLINLEGVMSITFQLKIKRVIVKVNSSVSEQDILEAISDVSENIIGEVISSYKNFNDTTIKNESIISIPDYLPEPSSNVAKSVEVPVVSTLSIRSGFGSLLNRFSQAFTDYLW